MLLVSASRPVEAVTLAGADSDSAESTTARSGSRAAPFSSIFTWVAVSVIMVNWVASDPVPAVVGMATIPGSGPAISLPK